MEQFTALYTALSRTTYAEKQDSTHNTEGTQLVLALPNSSGTYSFW